jgi:predicted alpha/beta-hydrolase family hydrolase
VQSLVLAPEKATPRFVYVLAHGAGAGMTHAFLESFAVLLKERGVATFRYNFPYMESGSKRPDAPAVAHAAVRAACAEAALRFPGVPLVAGGKSFGGRMTSQAQAAAAIPHVQGVAFVGFPLHPPDKPGVERAEHLANVQVPMLFLSGTRDELAQLPLLEAVVAGLGARATLRLWDDADHSFHVPAKSKSGKKDPQVRAELADALVAWAEGVLAEGVSK